MFNHKHLKKLALTGAALVFALTSFAGPNENKISDIKWFHGSENCSQAQDPLIQVFALSPVTFILRQSKCVHYEGPFLYLLLGTEKALLLDTGATADAKLFPLRSAVESILSDRQKVTGKALTLIVAHSHGHSDHVAADSQFSGRANTTIIGKKAEDVIRFFHFTDWPNQGVTYDLGSRVLDILPLPGHEPSHIAVYDRETGILLTGDSFYPGHLFVSDWTAYLQSMDRLVKFIQDKSVTAILGGHIEMTKSPFVAYEYPTLFQPHEHQLDLTAKALKYYNQVLQKQKQPDSKLFKDFILSNQTAAQ